MASYTIHVNGADHTIDALPDMPLLWVLRDFLDLTGTKYGCGIGACGACTVIMDGEATRSCQVQIKDVASAKVTTIEGLDVNGNHPVQQSWVTHDVPQCGYCQCGQIMSAVALLSKNPKPSDKEIDEAYAAQICRCGTYVRIREAVKHAGGHMGEK